MINKRIPFLITLICCVASLAAQQTGNVLSRQRKMFPQEQVYVMTDRDLYVSGDTIWMRPWIYDCNTRKPQSRSKYVYVELRDAADNLKRRVKVINRDGQMDGYLPLAADLMSGDYTLCAYTYYMTGTTDEMFFKKRIHIMKSADIAAGLYPVNLANLKPETLKPETLKPETLKPETLKPGTQLYSPSLPVGSVVAVSITNDKLCLADTTSSVVWSLKHQPPLFTMESIRRSGVLYTPTVPYEIGQIVSGTVYGNISTKKPQKGIKMSLMVPSKKIFDIQLTDSVGHFTFMGFNLPDSTLIYLAGKKGKRTTMDNITIDNDSLPELIHPLPATPRYFKRTKTQDSDFRIMSNIIDMANTQLLDEVVVKGKDRSKPGSEYDNTAEKTMKASDFASMGCYDVRSALMVMPGLSERAGVFYFRNQPTSIYVDGVLETDNSQASSRDGDAIDMLAQESPAMNYPIEIVERIDLLRPEDASFLTGGAGQGVPAICISLKEGADLSKYNDSSVKAIFPLGYQKHKDFTPHSDVAWPVLYWNPSITIDGPATITAILQKVLHDSPSANKQADSTTSPGHGASYTIHIDGFAPDGTPVHEQATVTK